MTDKSDTPSERDECWALLTEARRELADCRKELERGYQHLESCGVSRERAKSVGNGIVVLAARYEKECRALREASRLASHAEREKPVLPCLVNVGSGHFHAGVAVATVQGAIDRMFARMVSLQEKYEPISEDAKQLFSGYRRAIDGPQAHSHVEREVVMGPHVTGAAPAIPNGMYSEFKTPTAPAPFPAGTDALEEEIHKLAVNAVCP